MELQYINGNTVLYIFLAHNYIFFEVNLCEVKKLFGEFFKRLAVGIIIFDIQYIFNHIKSGIGI